MGVAREGRLLDQGLIVAGVRDTEEGPQYGALTTRPTAEEQIRFIANIERILSEGSFVATYKYALLVALVDLAIERGDDSNRELALPVDAIAEKFAELYWPQTRSTPSDLSTLRHCDKDV